MDTSPNPTLEDDIKQVLAEVPAPVRAFIASGKVQIIAKNLMQKNQLHIDKGAIIGRELTLLLLGINTPAEFTNTLDEEAKLDQQTINGIVKDVNDQIFVPLREEMRKGPQVVPQMPKPVAAAQPPREGMLQPRTTMIPANPQLPQRPAQTLASVPRYVPPKKYFNLQNKIPPASPKATQDTAKLLEDHEEPHIEFSKTPMPIKTAPPPPNLPGAIYHPPIPESPMPPLPPPKPEPVAPVIPVAPYSADPYRETIEP